MEQLDLVDEYDKVIGVAPRDEVHAKGLLHREVHVWVYTPEGKIVWQRRAPHKSFGGKFDATAGGHVSSGENYLSAALRELEEETGIVARPKALEFRRIQRMNTPHSAGGGNNVQRALYFYKLNKNISKLQVEPSAGDGFGAFSLIEMHKACVAKDERFIQCILEAGVPIFRGKFVGWAGL